MLVAARLSRVTEKGKTRIERDDEQAQKWAIAQGDREVVATAEDPGVSGATDPFKRPGLGPYLTDPALLATYDEVVASTLDRLGRNARDLARLRDWAEDNNKRITILSPLMHWPPDPDDFASPIIWDVLGRVAEMELRIITKRYADQRRDLLERGSLIGKAPWGFEIVGEKGNKTLLPDPALLPYLKGMVERALRGDTLLSICRWLDGEGAKPVASATWHPKSVSQILRQPALKGRRLDAKGRVIGKHDGVMSAAEWNKLQAALDARPRRRGPVTSATPFLTSSLVCGLCGGPMYRIRSTTRRNDGSANINSYYRCKGSDRAPSTCRNMVPQGHLEAWVDQWFTNDGPYATTELVETVVTPGRDHSAEVAEVDSELRQLDFDAPNFAKKQKSLLEERSRLKALPAEPSKVEQRPTGRTVREVWQSLTDEDKRRFLQDAGMQVHARPLQRGEFAVPRFYPGGQVRVRHALWVTGNPFVTMEALKHIKEPARQVGT